jgi:hypothetical protein
MKMAVFWDVSPCSVVDTDHVSEVLTASIIRVTSVNIYQTAGWNVPEDSRHLHKVANQDNWVPVRDWNMVQPRYMRYLLGNERMSYAIMFIRPLCFTFVYNNVNHPVPRIPLQTTCNAPHLLGHSYYF